MRLIIQACLFVLALAGCTPVPPGTVRTTINTVMPWQPPPGAQPAPLSATPNHYDFSGLSVAVNGQPMSPDQGLAETVRFDSFIVGQIVPGSEPIEGTARIVVPDHDRLRLIPMQMMRLSASGPIDYQAEQQRIALHSIADAVVRSGMFRSAAVAEENDTVAPDPLGADYLIWYRVQSLRPDNAGPWIGSWQIRRARSPAALAVTMDPGTPVGPARYQSFLRSIRGAVAGLASGRGSVAGPGAPGPVAGGRAVSGGTGIVIDRQGHVLTNNHVIANCPDVRIAGIGSATVVSNDAAVDLALLQTSHRFAGWARFRDSSGLRPGETVVVTGFPLTGLVSPEMAVTTGSITTTSGAAGNADRFQFSAPVQPGNSGGPVIDDTGRVVGVASFELNGLIMAAVTGTLPQNVNFGIKSDAAREFVARNAVALDEAPRRGSLNPAAIGDLARRFTVKVECFR